MVYIVVGAVIAVGLFMISPMVFPGRKIKEHKGLSKDVFTAQLSAQGVPEHISSVVYDYYKRRSYSREFNPSPEMDINGIFDEGPEDIDDAARALLKELHLSSPSEADRETWASSRDIRTVGDLAQWLHWASQHQPA
ncbi:MAG: hypothetical protein ACLGXA_23275 [Acidobacteriota bacterium]